MKVYLKHKLTGGFYAGKRQWVKDSGRAVDFGDVDSAAAAWLMEDLGEAQVVVSYEKPRCDLVLPVQEDWFGERKPPTIPDTDQ